MFFDSLTRSLSRLLKAILAIPRIPRKLSCLLQESIDSWSEMAPYRIRSMAMNFNSMSATGLSAAKSGTLDRTRKFPDEFRRRSMIVWSFLDSDRRNFGRNSLITAHQWMRLAALYREYGLIGDALIFYRRALKIFRLHCPPADERLTATQKALADFYMVLGKPAEAEILLREIVEATARQPSASDTKILTSSPSDRHLNAERAATIHLLSGSIKQQGKLLEAAEVLSEMVDFYEAQGLPGSEECINVYNELSSAYAQLGNKRQADLFLKTARQLRFTLMVIECSGDARVLIVELERLAELYRQRHRNHIVSAIELRIAICQLLAKVSGRDYPGIEADLEQLAQHYDSRNNPGDAFASFHLRARAKRIAERRDSRQRAAILTR